MIKNYYQRIDKLNIDVEAKEGYKWLVANLDAVNIATKKCKTIGDFRKKCFREIGFAPALIFSFQHLLKSEEIFVKELEEVLK